jgi:MFS family permease
MKPACAHLVAVEQSCARQNERAGAKPDQWHLLSCCLAQERVRAGQNLLAAVKQAADNDVIVSGRLAHVGHSRYLLLGIGAFVLVTVANYCLAFYLPTYAVRNLGLPPVSAFAGTLLIGAIQTVLAPFFGTLSDRYGRTPIMLFASLGLAVLAVPCFLVLVAHPTVLLLLLSQAILGTMLTAYQAPMPALLCDLFPATLRATSVAIVHDFTATLIGGFTPFAITFAIGITGNNLVPGIYVGVAACLSFTCLWTIRSMFYAPRGADVLSSYAPSKVLRSRDI